MTRSRMAFRQCYYVPMVKYADSPTTSVEVHINQPPDAVWPIVSDINTPAAFSNEFMRAEWISDEPAPGATFRGWNKHPVVGEWDVECTVTDYAVDQSFGWMVGQSMETKAASWRFDLEPASGGSTLRFTAVMGPGRSGLTPAIERMPDREEDIVAGRLKEWTDNMQSTVDGIRDRAEAGRS